MDFINSKFSPIDVYKRQMLQSIIQKRSDAFTQGLMDKLLQERNTLNDLSMLDPLTGLSLIHI